MTSDAGNHNADQCECEHTSPIHRSGKTRRKREREMKDRLTEEDEDRNSGSVCVYIEARIRGPISQQRVESSLIMTANCKKWDLRFRWAQTSRWMNCKL